MREEGSLPREAVWLLENDNQEERDHLEKPLAPSVHLSDSFLFSKSPNRPVPLAIEFVPQLLLQL